MTLLIDQPLHVLQDALRKREISARELVSEFHARIRLVEGQVHAYHTLTEEAAMQAAGFADAAIAAGEAGPLTGIPMAIKDNLCVEGTQTTCASKMLADFVSPYDATVIARLRQAGAVFLGKTNMDEFAMGSSTENSAFGKTCNPWDLSRIPGGSSGGSAAAVAASEASAALGSDTGGSIRQPAACCGVVGLKPTYGRVSRYGLVAFASSLDQIGPITHDVRDAAILMNILSGPDPRDSTSAPLPVPDFTATLTHTLQGVRLGVPAEYFVPGMDPEVEAAISAAIRQMTNLGATVLKISLPHTEYAVATYYIVATAEASSNLARYDGVRYGHRAASAEDLMEMYTNSRREGFGPEVKRRIMLGTYVLSSGYYDAYYKKAQQVRTLMKQDFDEAFKTVDAILTPTAPTPAFRIGEKAADPLSMYLSDIFTISVNLAGLPALSLPCGFSRGGLPIGLQIIGRPFDEAGILQVAHAYEQSTEFHLRRPKLA
jgi:aspartyl-tRNA(Asn)/glutamyl-tRNA(Gln) amidotransferase subunit A